MIRVTENLRKIRDLLAEAAEDAGRNTNCVNLLAVSKKQPFPRVLEAIEAGQREFGENQAAEGIEKIERLADDELVWHFIGHLQSNKTRFVPGRFHWLHTLDSLKLARRLSTACADTGSALRVLLQVNIANDPHKFGLQPESTVSFAADLLQLELPGLQLRGLMTIGRGQASPVEQRHDFAALRRLRDACAAQLGDEYFPELSMGMSGDFEIAISEGATMIRIGSSIFGPRSLQSTA